MFRRQREASHGLDLHLRSHLRASLAVVCSIVPATAAMGVDGMSPLALYALQGIGLCSAVALVLLALSLGKSAAMPTPSPAGRVVRFRRGWRECLMDAVVMTCAVRYGLAVGGVIALALFALLGWL